VAGVPSNTKGTMGKVAPNARPSGPGANLARLAPILRSTFSKRRCLEVPALSDGGQPAHLDEINSLPSPTGHQVAGVSASGRIS